jgi:hypothetical protein
MKQKTIYIIVVVCCLSLFSSAKQAGTRECPKTCQIKQKLAEEEARAKEEAKKSYDLSPLQLFMFSI